ncbi:SGNH/GDSL hydrolase family protein [Herbiconiux sp. P15]|uniref:SGNH/GDSL hydrolase family protein n=1 Tax=Herbiconiux liukaitaii TaxID=3342799 RepID=UPI0035B9F668
MTLALVLPSRESAEQPSTQVPIAGVQNTDAPQATDSPSDGRVMVTFLGDSFTSGSRQDSGVESRYPYLVGEALGIDVHSAGLGGAGYTTEGTAGETFSSLVTRIHVDSQAIVVFGSAKDRSGYDAVFEAASSMYEVIESRFPDAELIIVGPAPIGAVTGADVADSVRALSDAAAGAGATFVDATDWLSGDPSLLGNDRVHPNDAGHALMATKFESVVRDVLADDLG